jgi:hypothetical protein
MKNCFACNAECEDTAIICTTCGSIADQPVVETDPVAREKAVVPNFERSEFTALEFGSHWTDRAYGRMEYLKGTLKLCGVSMLAFIPASMMLATNNEVAGGVGIVLLLCISLWTFLRHIELLCGRMQDFGCRTGFLKFLMIMIITFVPIVGFVFALCVLFAPRNQFAK